jgi:CRISPR-associated protein Cas1
MLSLPDFKEKKIVLVPIEEGLESQLKLKNNNICLYKKGILINKISCSIVFSLITIGDCTITTKLLWMLKKYGISLVMLDYSLNKIANITSKAEGNYILRSRQYTIAEETELGYAKKVISNKIKNQLTLLQMKKSRLKESIADNIISQITDVSNKSTLLGIEGNISAIYFSELFKEMDWYRRAPRTKQDITNMLLDIGYTQLFNFVDALLNLFGFDTYKGFYHQLFFQRKSLTCDLMEPFRPLIDKHVINMHNLKQIDTKDFKFYNRQYIFKNFEARKKYIGLFFEIITKNKEYIYNYILGYYRHIQNPEKYKFPSYKLK